MNFIIEGLIFVFIILPAIATLFGSAILVWKTILKG